MATFEQAAHHLESSDMFGFLTCPACGSRNEIPLTPNVAVRVTHTSDVIHTFSPYTSWAHRDHHWEPVVSALRTCLDCGLTPREATPDCHSHPDAVSDPQRKVGA